MSETYTLEQQVEIIERWAPTACALMRQMADNYRETLIENAVKRLQEVGYADYGDASFHKTEDELWDEAVAEGADQLVYHCIWLEKRDKRLAQEAKDRLTGGQAE